MSIGQWSLDERRVSVAMDLTFNAQQEEFRAEVREWMAGHVPASEEPTDRADLVEYQRWWQAELATASLVAVHFPAEFGGRGLGWIEAYVVQEEMAYARAPEIVNRVAINLVGPTLIEHGTADQRERYLRRIVTAEDIWCQLFSEPEAGSDLSSMRTMATPEDGGWRVSGQKVWASNAQYADLGVLLARTGTGPGMRPEIGYFLIDMHQRGIDVRPLRQMTGASDFNEVFFDNAWVSTENVVGDPRKGWGVMKTTLGYERSTSPRQLIIHTVLLEQLLEEFRLRPQTALVRQRLAQLYGELRIYRLHLYRTLSDLENGRKPGPASSVIKLYWSEMAQRMHELSLDMLGMPGIALPSSRARNYVYYRACTIFAGTSEIQRNTLAEQVLGLPVEKRPKVEEGVAFR
jgi:alkylation response protein AidB-like acyl-CoA dehydrogenase